LQDAPVLEKAKRAGMMETPEAIAMRVRMEEVAVAVAVATTVKSMNNRL
jgi:hypothetical protein